MTPVARILAALAAAIGAPWIAWAATGSADAVVTASVTMAAGLLIGAFIGATS
jgi:hypothetical protein